MPSFFGCSLPDSRPFLFVQCVLVESNEKNCCLLWPCSNYFFVGLGQRCLPSNKLICPAVVAFRAIVTQSLALGRRSSASAPRPSALGRNGTKPWPSSNTCNVGETQKVSTVPSGASEMSKMFNLLIGLLEDTRCQDVRNTLNRIMLRNGHGSTANSAFWQSGFGHPSNPGASLLLVVWPGAPSSVLAPSSMARNPTNPIRR